MEQILASLREYAAEPPSDMPPEIPPCGPADRWGLDGAARRALGLLLAGDDPFRRIGWARQWRNGTGSGRRACHWPAIPCTWRGLT